MAEARRFKMKNGERASEFIGKNYLNLHLGGAEAQMGFNFVTIYPTVSFGKNVKLGNFVTVEDFCVIEDDVLIGNVVVIRPETFIGSKTKIGHHCVLEGDIVIGKNCIIQTHCHITHGARIADKVMFGPGVTGVNDNDMLHPGIRPSEKPWEENPFRIESGVRIGAGAIIMGGVTIRRNAFVKAGTVVVNDVGENEIIGGNPAMVIGEVPVEQRI